MTELLRRGSGILYMKVGTHAREDLGDIVERKREEIDDAGYSLWGYGGNTCHPRTMVQPFARDRVTGGAPIYLCMQPMNSKHFAEQVRADQYSADGIEWNDIPDAINVLGSRYALCLGSLIEVEEELSLAATRVAVGKSKGRFGSDYISGRVDKACLEITDDAPHPEDEKIVEIRLAAELVEPYAVFLRNS